MQYQRFMSTFYTTVVVVFLLLVGDVTAQDNGTSSDTDTATDASNATCYTNSTLLHYDMQEKDPFETVTYILCPNTIFEIGVPNNPPNTFREGQIPLLLRRSTHILCGDDGSSTNNCTFTGGSYQVWSNLVAYGDTIVDDVVIQGISFRNGDNIAILLSAPGNVSFIDCFFEHHQSIGIVKLTYFALPASGRLLWDVTSNVNDDESKMHYSSYSQHENQYDHFVTEDEEMWDPSKNDKNDFDNRRLQSDDGSSYRQAITFEKCIFRGNSAGTEGTLPTYGVVDAITPFNDLVFKECVFLDNTFDVETEAGESFAVKIVNGSTISLQDTCYYNNTFIGRGIILLDDETGLLSQGGNHGPDDPDLECPFISVGIEQQEACIEFSSTTCFDERYTSVNTAPSPPPPTPPPPTSSSASVLQLCWFVTCVLLSFLHVSNKY